MLFSEARFVVLRTIYLAAGANGVSLREIAYRSELSLGAVQTALKSLLRMRMLLKQRQGQRTLFRLNTGHPEYPLVIALFDLSTKQMLRSRAARDSAANQTLMASLNQMIRFARGLREASSGA